MTTTDSNHALEIYLNLARRMTPAAINQLWVADITYIRLLNEFVYLALVLDSFSRKLVAWKLDRTLASRLATDALESATAVRTRIMFDFFGCEDAMVLDEGYDTFQIANPFDDLKGRYKCTNSQLLGKILTLTKELINEEQRQSLQREEAEMKSGTPYKFLGGLKEYPLNRELFRRIDEEEINA